MPHEAKGGEADSTTVLMTRRDGVDVVVGQGVKAERIVRWSAPSMIGPCWDWRKALIVA